MVREVFPFSGQGIGCLVLVTGDGKIKVCEQQGPLKLSLVQRLCPTEIVQDFMICVYLYWMLGTFKVVAPFPEGGFDC